MADDPRPRRLQTANDRDAAARRDRSGAPEAPWHEEATGVHTDGQVFRALKGLRDDLEANKVEAARAHGALKAEVVALASTVAKQGEKLDDVTTTAARMEGKLDVMLADRRPASSTQQRVVETLLTDKVNAEAHKRERVTIGWRGLINVISSPPVIAGLAAGLALLAARGC